MDALTLARLQFAVTTVYHFFFVPLTLGLSVLVALMQTLYVRTGNEQYKLMTKFWGKLFLINFAMGVVTGIPMEFQFGTNWARFSRYSGNVVGHTLAMEGLFAFFLESSFLSLLVWGEKRLSKVGHFLAAGALFAGSWLSGYFITATNAFMQHPVGHAIGPDGVLHLADFRAFVLNPWAIAQYAHNMVSTVVTASFVLAALGAFYLLQGRSVEPARLFVKLGLTVGLLSSVLLAFPTGDIQAKLVGRYQPVALAAMEGRFESGPRAQINLIGQPNLREKKLDNPISVPGALSFLAYGHFYSDVRGLSEFPEKDWPDNIELLYYAFHIMAGLGTILIAIMVLANLLAWTKRLEKSRPMLWVLMLAFPFPYIAVMAGWLTTELGRQPWLVYGLFRTADGASPMVNAGTTLFTLIGFCGLYTVLSVLFLFLIAREIGHGPRELSHA